MHGFPSQNQQNVKFMPEIVIFSWNLLIAQGPAKHVAIEFSIPQTQNMCHSSNFNAFFPVKSNKMWNYLPETVIFQEPLYHRDLKSVVLNVALPQTLNTAPLKPFQCIFPCQNQQNVKFLSEIVIFFWNCLFHRLKTCGIGFGICQTLHMSYSSHFNAFFPVKINKMWNFLSEIVIF